MEGVQPGGFSGGIAVIEKVEKGVLADGGLFRGDAFGGPTIERVTRLGEYAPRNVRRWVEPQKGIGERAVAIPDGGRHKPPRWREEAARESATSGFHRY